MFYRSIFFKLIQTLFKKSWSSVEKHSHINILTFSCFYERTVGHHWLNLHLCSWWKSTKLGFLHLQLIFSKSALNYCIFSEANIHALNSKDDLSSALIMCMLSDWSLQWQMRTQLSCSVVICCVAQSCFTCTGEDSDVSPAEKVTWQFQGFS